MIRHLKSQIPKIHPDSYLDEASIIIGDVRIAKDVSVWPGAVLRGDDNYIEIGERSNIQDGCVCHVTADHPLVIGKDVTIGHGVMLHACTIEDEALIGIGAVILDGAIVERGAQVGAGALVPPGKVVPSGSLALGVPAKVVRKLSDEENREIIDNAEEYVNLWKEKYL